MKKQYIMPEMAIVNVELQQMMAGSGPEDGFTKTGADELSEETVSGNMSRRGNYWDDEDEY